MRWHEFANNTLVSRLVENQNPAIVELNPTLEESMKPLDSTATQIMDALVAYLKKQLDAQTHNVLASVDGGDIETWISEFFKDFDKGYEHLEQLGLTHRNEFLVFSKHFKSKYGKAITKYAEHLDDQLEAASFASATPSEQRLLRAIGEELTVGKISPQWARDNLCWYERKLKAGDRVVIKSSDGNWLPAIGFKQEFAEQHGMDLEAFKQWLTQLGMRNIKRPVRPRLRPLNVQYD